MPFSPNNNEVRAWNRCDLKAGWLYEMSEQVQDHPPAKQGERSGEVQSFTIKYWWLNFVRGIVALMLGLGLLLPVEVILEADNLQDILFQFIGIYLLLSGIMSLVWGLSNNRRFGLWIVAAVLGLVGGIAFFLRSFLEGYFSATVLTVIFGLIMLLAGLIHLLGGFRLGKAYGRRWSWGHEFLGLVEIGIGILLLISIVVTVENLRIILSFWGLVAGIGLIADGIRMRRLKKTAPTTALNDPNAPVEPE
jgi:uncharacterized membrane protein HdeD (DUF308 family)